MSSSMPAVSLKIKLTLENRLRVCYELGMADDAVRRPRRLPRAATGVRPGGVTGRVAGGDHRRRTQRQAHRIRQRDLGARSGRPAAGASAHPRREGRVVTDFHRRRRSAVRRGAPDRGRRQAARVVVAVARRGRRGRRGAGAAGWRRAVFAPRVPPPHGGRRDAAAVGAPPSTTTSGCELCARTTRCRRCCTPAIRCGTGITTSGPTTRICSTSTEPARPHPAARGCAAGGGLRRQPRWQLRRDVVAAARARCGHPSALVRIDLATGERTAIADDPDADLELPAISPDGSAVAFTRETHSTPDKRRESRCATCVSASHSSN